MCYIEMPYFYTNDLLAKMFIQWDHTSENFLWCRKCPNKGICQHKSTFWGATMSQRNLYDRNCVIPNVSDRTHKDHLPGFRIPKSCVWDRFQDFFPILVKKPPNVFLLYNTAPHANHSSRLRSSSRPRSSLRRSRCSKRPSPQRSRGPR